MNRLGSMTPMRLAPALLVLSSCAATVAAITGGAGEWHAVRDPRPTAELMAICTQLLDREGFGVAASDPAAGTIESRWRVILAPIWRAGVRDRFEVRIAHGLVEWRTLHCYNDEHQFTQSADRASWVPDGGDERLSERFGILLKMRLEAK